MKRLMIIIPMIAAACHKAETEMEIRDKQTEAWIRHERLTNDAVFEVQNHGANVLTVKESGPVFVLDTSSKPHKYDFRTNDLTLYKNGVELVTVSKVVFVYYSESFSETPILQFIPENQWSNIVKALKEME